MKKIMLMLCALMMISGCSSTSSTDTDNNATDSDSDYTRITLNGDTAYVDGVEIEESDYTWHVDPSAVHEDVENAPAEYYTGTKLDADIYIDHELYYYPDLGLENYTLINYDGEREYAYYYNDGVNDEYIFATLPNLGTDVLESMMHTEEEAAENKVLHINKAGTYELEGTWNGQISIDVDDDEKVTVILNGVDITCTVAPGIIFLNAYECEGEYSDDFNTDDAGVTVVLAEGSENTVTGNNVFRMLKTVYKSDSTDVQKKMRKYDAAFYSCVSMNIEGEGSLTVNSNFEGLDTEMHLTFRSGNVTINSVDDGINVNEDNVSVVSFSGGNVTINHASGSEGDGVDSNGYIVMNGGNITVNGVVAPDNAMDSEDGIYYTSGTITVDDEVIEKEPGTYHDISSSNQGFGGGKGMNFNPGNMPNDKGDFNPEDINIEFDINEFKEKVAELDDDATIEDVMEILGVNFSRNMPMDRPDNKTGDNVQQ